MWNITINNKEKSFMEKVKDKMNIMNNIMNKKEPIIKKINNSEKFKKLVELGYSEKEAQELLNENE